METKNTNNKIDKYDTSIFHCKTGKIPAFFISSESGKEGKRKCIQNINKVFFEAAIRNLSDEEKQMYINYLLSLSDKERKDELAGIYSRMLTNSCSK